MSKLGVNIDHVATLRNARGENHPNILKFADIAINVEISIPGRILVILSCKV